MNQETASKMENQAYHNTVPVQGEELERARLSVFKQERDVLHYFKQLEGLRLITPYSMHKLLQDRIDTYKRVPVDSIKRAFSNLKNAGKIRKNGVKIKGDYGRSVNCWESVK